MGDGIAADIISGFPKLVQLLEQMLARVVGGGLSAEEHIAPQPPTKGVPRPVLSMVDRILPAFTIVNNGTATVNFGSGGIASHALPVGASYTYRWKNPKASKIVIDDLGTQANVDVIS